MTAMTTFELFAEILDYPTGGPDRAVEECVARLGPQDDLVAALLRNFQAGLATLGLGQLQELYTGTFDMVPDCSLNLGYQLFGDDWRRSAFLADLAGRCRQCGASAGAELPDHLCFVLRFLARQEDGRERELLINECLIPALTRLLSEVHKSDNPYSSALDALLLWLKGLAGKNTAGAETQTLGDERWTPSCS